MRLPSLPVPWLNISWGVFLLIAVTAFFAVTGFSLSIGLILLFIIAVLLVLRFPFASVNIAFCSLLLAGIIVPINTGTIQVGERAFGASIEVTLGELVTVVVMFGWALRLFIVDDPRTRLSARPWLPLALGFTGIVLAQILSAFSPADPDVITVLKYALRPVLFMYLAAIALPANFLRSWRRMDQACWCLVGLGVWFALDALHSLLIFSGDSLGLYRAHPLPFFGINLLGGNHHALAELMVLVAPLALALGARLVDPLGKRCMYVLAGWFWLIALLTFARAAWLVVAIELGIGAMLLWRDWLYTHRKKILWSIIILMPLLAYMIWFSIGRGVEQSTAARGLLLDIAWSFFRDSPLVGVGAGTFADRVARIWAFTVEYGAAQDAHGLIQKILAETGLLGAGAFGLTLYSLVSLLRNAWDRFGGQEEREWFIYMCMSVVGALSYQLFSTSLWSPRVWISVGLICAGLRLLRTRALQRDPDFLRSL